MSSPDREPDDDDVLVPILDDDEEDDAGNRRDAAQSNSFGSEHLDRKLRDDDDDGELFGPAIPRSAVPQPPKPKPRPTRLADDGSYSLSDDAAPDQPAAPEPRRNRAPATVADERLCRECGYNLFGLPLDGRCPECGTPVGALGRSSVVLAGASRAWLERLALGCRIAFWGILVGFLLNPVFYLAPLPAIVEAALGGLAVMAIATGLFLLAAAEAGARAESQALRLTLRGLAIGLALTGALNFAFVALYLRAAGNGTTPVIPAAVLWAQILLNAVAIGVFPVSAFYLRHLAWRGMNAEVETRAGTAAYGLSFTLGTVAVLMVAFVAAGVVFATMPGLAGGGGILAALLGCMGLLMIIPLLIFGGHYILLLAEAGIMFRHAADPGAEPGGQRESPETMREREQAIAKARQMKRVIRIAR